MVADWPWFRAKGSFPIPPYSERAATPYLIRKPYGTIDDALFSDDDLWGWPITEYEDAFLLRPGMEQVARPIIHRLLALLRYGEDLAIGAGVLDGNPYWAKELSEWEKDRPLVFVLSLALAITQDDKGRLRWTLLGGSDSPEAAFWRGFFTSPHQEIPSDQALAFLRRWLQDAFGATDQEVANLHDAGLRILADDDQTVLPSWTSPLVCDGNRRANGVRYVLTFRPYTRLPNSLRTAFLSGAVELLPHPVSLVPWGSRPYRKLHETWADALQLPLLLLSDRHEGLYGLRVPQSGWMSEPFADGSEPSPYPGRRLSKHKRSRRHSKRRHFGQDELADAAEDHLAHVLFSTAPDDVGLYDKPQAQNVQIWTHHFQPLLNGPTASRDEIRHAASTVKQGGWFGYRFVFPAARVGRYEVIWHRPVVAYVPRNADEPVVVPDSPLGHLTAHRTDVPSEKTATELWPRILRRDAHVANVELFGQLREDPPHATLLNVRKLLDARSMWQGKPMPAKFARRVVTLPRRETLDAWLDALAERHRDSHRAKQLVEELRRSVEPETGEERRRPPRSITYAQTARRSFEVAYWHAIAELSAGDFMAKNNGDPALDPATRHVSTRHTRDLDRVGTYLFERHEAAVKKAGMQGRALVGDLPFKWTTHFDYPWLGGWAANRDGQAHERSFVVVIPGRDRTQAVLMADHYDTAYMEDRYYRERGGSGARLAAPGADDNGSATAALLLGAPIFLSLSRAGRLARDIWLIHFTGEEYPAEGLGARNLCERLVQGALRLRLPDSGEHDLSAVQLKGAFVLDMIAHNSRKGRNVFQISPGAGQEAMGLAYQAHLAAEAWNESTPFWNRRSSRRNARRGRRSRGQALPPIAQHPQLSGEIRVPYDPRSALYNTDGQELSDCGVPVVLLMENYDINRTGYHDSRDTLANVNLDYGAALAAIAIEAVARAATQRS